MKWRQAPGTAMIASVLVACAPALDWREFMPEGSGVGATFPCRPDRHARVVAVAGSRVQMELLVCSAGGSTFALGFVDIADPVRVTPALGELRDVMLANVNGAAGRVVPAQVTGMTPNPQALRLATSGRLPDGAPVQAEAMFFVKGLRVYQATVIGTAPAPQVIETFFGGLKFPS